MFSKFMNTADKTIFYFDGLTYVFTNDTKPNKKVRATIITDSKKIRIYQDGTWEAKPIKKKERLSQ